MKFFALFLALAAVGDGLDLNKIQNDAKGMAEQMVKDGNVGGLVKEATDLVKGAEDQVNKLTKDLNVEGLVKGAEDQVNKLTKDLPKMVKGRPSKFAMPSPKDFQKKMKEKFEAKLTEMGKMNAEKIQKLSELVKEKGLAKSKFLKLIYLESVISKASKF